MSPPEDTLSLRHDHDKSQAASLASTLETDFAITRNGFIPSNPPLGSLPDPYYQAWETIAQNLPKLLREGSLRKEVDNLPVLSLKDKLQAEPQWRRVYLLLSFITHAYIWGGDAPSERLPPQVTLPLLQASAHFDLPPVATYAAINLWNFTSASSSFSDLDSLQALLSFTGTKDESWFYMISVAMECEGGQIIPTMLGAMESIPAGDRSSYEVVTAALEQLMACIRRVGAVLERMHEHCEPDVFFHAIRPFLAGSKNMASAGLPNGVLYDEGEGKGEWRRLRGGSNGQSSLIQFFDIVLGVEHAATESQNSSPASGAVKGTTRRSDEEEKELPFHEEVRAYMPGQHRRFLERVRSLPSIRRLALQPPLPSSDPLLEKQALLRDTFQRATRVLTEFRNKHLQIVTRYIVVPSRKQQLLRGSIAGASSGSGTGAGAAGISGLEERRVGLAGVAWRMPPQNPVAVPKRAGDPTAVGGAGASRGDGVGDGPKAPRRSSETQLTGTGGTALMPFLKQVRDETARAGRPDDDGTVV